MRRQTLGISRVNQWKQRIQRTCRERPSFCTHLESPASVGLSGSSQKDGLTDEPLLQRQTRDALLVLIYFRATEAAVRNLERELQVRRWKRGRCGIPRTPRGEEKSGTAGRSRNSRYARTEEASWPTSLPACPRVP